MKKIFYRMIFLMLLVFALMTTAQVSARVIIALPPPIIFAAPPEVVVLPGTYVYVVPDVPEDFFFYNGWWWRPWGGHWYRSRYYDSGWVYFNRVPNFYGRIPSGWRNDYREHRWEGREWNYQRIHHQELRNNWSAWQKNKYWEKQHTWGVQGWQSHPHGLKPVKQERENRPYHEAGPRERHEREERR